MAQKSKKADADELFTTISGKIEDAIAHTSRWAAKQVKWHKLRMRIKKEKNFPFPNCSNIRMPTGETKIRKIKAALVNVVFGIRPVVQAVPYPGGNFETGLKIEKFLDHLIMEVMKLKPKAVIAIDQELEKGMYILQPYYRVDTIEREEEISLAEFDLDTLAVTPIEVIVDVLMQELEADTSDRVVEDNKDAILKGLEQLLKGKNSVKIELQDVIYDAPDVALISPERCYVPTDTGYNPQDAEMIAIEKYLPLRVVKENAQNGKGWDVDAVNSITSMQGFDFSKDKQTDIDKDMREGIERIQNPSELVRIWEVQGWFKIGEDTKPKKYLLTIAPDFRKTLRKRALPWASGRYNIVKLSYELIDDRWFSHRGIIEIIEDIIKEIDIQHMQKIDNQTVRNAPMFVYRAGLVNPGLMQFIPNQGIPVHGMHALKDTVDILNNNNPNVEFSYEREEQILLGRIEELIGQVDYNLQSQINRREPRTLGEVNLQNQSQQQVFSLDASQHTDSFSELFTWIWDLWSQFGPDSYEFNYFGADQEQGETIKLSREEIQGKYKICVRGNDQNTNPQIKLEKAQAILQAALNPVAIQTGVITPENIANSYKRFYQTMQIENWEELVQAQPQPQAPPPQEPLVTPSFADLEDGEKAQILTQLGIQPDMEGRYLNKQHELIELQSKVEKETRKK